LEGISEWIRYSQQRDKEIQCKLDQLVALLSPTSCGELPSIDASAIPHETRTEKEEITTADMFKMQYEVRSLSNQTNHIKNRIEEHHQILTQIQSLLLSERQKERERKID